MWTVSCLVNTVLCPNDCIHDLFDEGQDYKGELWEDLDQITDENHLLYFNPDHMEHMDYLDAHPEIINILKRHEVEGDICFAEVEGDNAPRFWGYRFDGQGRMKKLKGNIKWKE